MATKYITPAYMKAFHCIGGDCKDTCCQHWDIHLDKAHYQKVQDCTTSNPDENTRFNKCVKINTDADAGDKNYASIILDEKGYCPYLLETGLCRLHDKFGQDVLGNICAFFPRVLSVYDETVEMTGAMSCPEIVRICLMDQQYGDEFSEFDIAILPRQDDLPLAKRATSRGLDFYSDNFLNVRNVMIETLKHDDFALETRVYFLSNFCHRVSQSYHQGCKGNKKTLEAELRRIRDKNVLNTLDNYFLNYLTSEPVAIIVIQAILQLRLQQNSTDSFAILIKDVFSVYQEELKCNETEVYGDTLPPDDLWQSYQHIWEKVNSRFGARLEDYLTRYLVNCLQREWFISMPDPFIYMHLITIRLAILRFLIVSHPEVVALLSKDTGDDIVRRFEQKVTDIVYMFARNIDHNHAFLNVVYQAISEQQMLSFDYAMPFIKF